MKNLSDVERERLAVRAGSRMRGPWEQGHCEHGRLYSYRWVWRVGEGPEDGEVELGSARCKLCKEASR